MNLNSTLAFFNNPIMNIGERTFTIGELFIVPLWLIIGYWLTKWMVSLISARLIARKTDPNLRHLLLRLIYIIAISIVLITTLDFINIPITAFAFLSGAIAIGFGFGAQNIINNFISGWILMWEQPIRIGDLLEVEDAKGNVEEINTRSTRIRRIDGVHILIPNSKLLENTVINWTLVDRLIRTSVRVGVAYGSPVKQVAELIMQATKEQPEILDDPNPIVSFEDFADNALVFEVNFWMDLNAEGGMRIIRSNLRFRIDELFSQHNIIIAFPQRDIHIDGALKLLRERQK